MAALLTRKRVAVWGTGLLLLSWFIYLHTMLAPGLVDRAGRFKGSDYIQFYVMGSMALDGNSADLYDASAHLAEGRRRIDPDLALYASRPNYGPQVALAFAPLALLPYGWSLGLFLALTALCYAGSVWIVWRQCPGLHAHGSTVALLAAASPLWFTLLRYGQASAFALLICSLALLALSRRREYLAGLAIGTLIYKPQLGLVLAIVVVAARQWRIAAGAIAMAAGQLGLAWLWGGTSTLQHYFTQLWSLIGDPRLVQIYPSEVHSLRGFLQLAIPSAPLVGLLYAAGLALLLLLARRSWLGSAPVELRMATVIVATVLASPHLITYDLVLLTLPLLVCADWIARHPGAPLGQTLTLLVILAYFAPFSSLTARFLPLQLSVVVMAGMLWRLHVISTGASARQSRHPAPNDTGGAGAATSVPAPHGPWAA